MLTTVKIEERKIHMLCPRCHRTIEGTIHLTMNTGDESIYVPDLRADIACPDCGCRMYSANMLTLPAVMMLHAKHYQVIADDDRYKDGNFMPDDLCGIRSDKKSEDGWYFGPFIAIEDVLTGDEVTALLDVQKEFNEKYSDFMVNVSTSDDRDPYATEDVTRHTVSMRLREDNITGVITANHKLAEFFETWLSVMAERGITRELGE